MYIIRRESIHCDYYANWPHFLPLIINGSKYSAIARNAAFCINFTQLKLDRALEIVRSFSCLTVVRLLKIRFWRKLCWSVRVLSRHKFGFIMNRMKNNNTKKVAFCTHHLWEGSIFVRLISFNENLSTTIEKRKHCKFNGKPQREKKTTEQNIRRKCSHVYVNRFAYKLPTMMRYDMQWIVENWTSSVECEIGDCTQPKLKLNAEFFPFTSSQINFLLVLNINNWFSWKSGSVWQRSKSVARTYVIWIIAPNNQLNSCIIVILLILIK